MNYKVTLYIFFFYVYVQSAIIGGRRRRHGNEGLQDEEAIQAGRHKKMDSLRRQFLTTGEKMQQFDPKNMSRKLNRNDLSAPKSSDITKRCTRYGTNYRNRKLSLEGRRGLLRRPYHKNSFGAFRQTPRILVGASSAKHNVIVGSPSKLAFNKKLCEQCRHSKLCKAEDNCKYCSQYCKRLDSGSVREALVSDEEVGISREPEDIVQVEDQKDRTLVSRAGEDSLENIQTMDDIADEENEGIDNQKIDDEVIQSAQSVTANIPTVGEFDEGIVSSTNQETPGDQTSRGVDAKGDLQFNKMKRDSRYYILGMINSGMLLNILSRLTSRNNHFDNKKYHFEKAIILVKSSSPIPIEHSIIDKMEDFAFLKHLEIELNIAERNHRGKAPLSRGEIEKLIQIAYAKAESKYKKGESHIVSMENIDNGEPNNETVGCSKEQSDTLPFFPIQSNLYRSGSVSQSEKTHHKPIVEPEEFENMEESIEKKQSKNPRVIQGNPNVESRINALKPNKQLEINHAVRTQIYDTISDQLKRLENMHFVGSTKKEAIKTEKYMKEQEKNQEKELNSEQVLREQKEIADDSSEVDSIEENDQARTFHKKKKMNKKKGYYVPSYGYGNSYGNQGHGYGNFYRHSYPAVVNPDSYKPHNNIDKQVGSAMYIGKDVEQTSSSILYPNSDKISNNDHNDFLQENEERSEAENENYYKSESSKKGTKVQQAGYGESLEIQKDDIPRIVLPKTNMKLDKKKVSTARVDINTKLSQGGLHDNFEKIQKNNKNEHPKSFTGVDDFSSSHGIDSKNEKLGGSAPTSLRQSNSVENIVSTKHKKYKHKGEFYRLSDSASSLEGEIRAVNDVEQNVLNGKIAQETKDPSNTLDAKKSKEKHTDHQGLMQNSRESIESNESFYPDSSNHPGDIGFTDYIPDKHLDKGAQSELGNGKHSLSLGTKTDNKLVSEDQLQVANDKTKKSTIDKSLPGKRIIQIDDQLVDVSKDRQPIFQKEGQPKFAVMRESIDNLLGEVPTVLEDYFNQAGLVENIVGDQNMPSERLKVNPQIMSDQSGQNLGFVVDMDSSPVERPEFSPKEILPSKISSETNNIPFAPAPASAPAFRENRKIEINIPNFISTIEHQMGNSEVFLEAEPKLEMTQINGSKFDQNRDVSDDNVTGNDIAVDSENIDKLITPQEREFLHNFGKIVPAAEKLHLGSNADVYFMGNGIKLPLKVSQDKTGSLALSVDLKKLCECKNATCSHKMNFLRQLENNIGGISNDSEMSLDIDEPDKSINIGGKAKRATHNTDFLQLNKYQNIKHRTLHKRSINESSKNNLEHKNIELTKNSAKMNSESELQNYSIKQLKHEKILDDEQIQYLHKFKKAEKQLEDRLEKLNKDVQKSNKHYNNMLKKGTKDLLQIKGEDQVVKQRIELVNDLLKWMKEMAEGMATLDRDNVIVHK